MQEEELKSKLARLDELNILLNMDKKENEIVGGEPDEGESTEKRKEKSYEFRVEKASEKISGSREDVEKFLLKDDKRKQDYYRKFAGGIWNDATNYDLCLNSGKLGFEKCVDVIEAQLKIMLNK